MNKTLKNTVSRQIIFLPESIVTVIVATAEVACDVTVDVGYRGEVVAVEVEGGWGDGALLLLDDVYVPHHAQQPVCHLQLLCLSINVTINVATKHLNWRLMLSHKRDILHSTLHVCVVSSTQTIQSSDWLK